VHGHRAKQKLHKAAGPHKPPMQLAASLLGPVQVARKEQQPAGLAGRAEAIAAGGPAANGAAACRCARHSEARGDKAQADKSKDQTPSSPLQQQQRTQTSKFSTILIS
jgi:hypothetical protein